MSQVVSLENVTVEYRRATTKSRSIKQASVEILKGKRKYQTFRALDGVSFEIRSGEILAVIGRNGSGKSTVLKMITRAFSPQAGTIRFDGLDIRQLTASDLRSRISYMPQNCDLFYGTIAQNLRLAHPSASDAELEWASSMANILDEIKAMREDMAKQHDIENKKIEELNRWRWIVMGGAAVIGWIVSKVFTFK